MSRALSVRVTLTAAVAVLLSSPVFAQEQPGDQVETAQQVDPVDRYNSRLSSCASCFQTCAHRWDPRRLSKELQRIGGRARRECEERCATFLKLGENECRGAYLGRTLGAGR